jgi:hypothetical protein
MSWCVTGERERTRALVRPWAMGNGQWLLIKCFMSADHDFHLHHELVRRRENTWWDFHVSRHETLAEPSIFIMSLSGNVSCLMSQARQPKSHVCVCFLLRFPWGSPFVPSVSCGALCAHVLRVWCPLCAQHVPVGTWHFFARVYSTTQRVALCGSCKSCSTRMCSLTRMCSVSSVRAGKKWRGKGGARKRRSTRDYLILGLGFRV